MSVSIPSDDPEQQPRRRGDRQRKAILGAVRELLQEVPFDDLSVSTISDRAGVARSGFYFYFDSKYAVLAQPAPGPAAGPTPGAAASSPTADERTASGVSVQPRAASSSIRPAQSSGGTPSAAPPSAASAFPAPLHPDAPTLCSDIGEAGSD